MTLFARDYTQKTSEGLQSMAFDVTNLVACIFVVHGCFGLAQSKTGKGKGISLGVIVAAIAFLFYKYSNLEGEMCIRDSLIVSITMMFGYFFTDVMSPLEPLLTAAKGAENGLGLGWNSDESGFFSGAYGYFNVFLLLLFFGGLSLIHISTVERGFLLVVFCSMLMTGLNPVILSTSGRSILPRKLRA